jgi:hypothetical protein
MICTSTVAKSGNSLISHGTKFPRPKFPPLRGIGASRCHHSRRVVAMKPRIVRGARFALRLAFGLRHRG